MKGVFSGYFEFQVYDPREIDPRFPQENTATCYIELAKTIPPIDRFKHRQEIYQGISLNDFNQVTLVPTGEVLYPVRTKTR